MGSSSGIPRPDSFTQNCRALVRTCTYEDIVACIIYAAPMVFIIGPASIVAMEPFPAIVLQSLIGFVLSWAVHRVGHGLLIALPKVPKKVYVSPSHYLPIRLTMTQFLWTMELLVGVASFCAILGKRLLQSDEEIGLLGGMSLSVAVLVLYFLPAYLGRFWIRNYYPAMTLIGPTEEVIKRSLPGLRVFSMFSRMQ